MLLQTRAADDASLYALYQYIPSLAPAIIALILFTIGGITHAVLIQRLHSKIFIPFAIGCFMEALGYCGRIWSHYDPTGLPGFIIQALLILIAPALFAASIYMVLARIITLIDGADYSLVPLKWLTKIFVIGDCCAFAVQCMGGGLQAGGTLTLLHTGEKIIVAGLFIQIFFFGFFVVSSTWFHVRMRAYPTAASTSLDIPWQRHMTVLYVASGLILIRSIFRVIEYLMGNTGWILRHEAMLYIFDSLLMIAVVAIFLWWHPGTLFQQACKGGLSQVNSATDVELISSYDHAGYRPNKGRMGRM